VADAHNNTNNGREIFLVPTSKTTSASKAAGRIETPAKGIV